MVRSGRLSKAAGLAGNMLSVKPITETSQGKEIVAA
ncbi:MAG: DegV family protein [Dehalococcoidales bacterium]|nr:DegV family protein [Dehalococcoidales bacterium]